MRTASVIIPTFNRAQLLRTALDSVQRLNVPPGWSVEVIVVDNGSTDETKSVVDQADEKGPLPIRHVVEKKIGLNHGRNRGVLAASSEYLIFLDDDMMVAPAWLDGLDEALQFDPDCVTGPVEPWFEEEPPPWLSGQALSLVNSGYSRKGDRVSVLGADCAYELPGCNFAVRRSAAVEAGGFHPGLDRSGNKMLAGGDFDFGVKLVRLGKRAVYSPKCKIRHFISRKKMSLEGLRARAEGLGATERAFEYLDGKDISALRWLRRVAGLIKMRLRAELARAMGRKQDAVERELIAASTKGYLFGAPKLEPRRWPPLPLTDD